MAVARLLAPVVVVSRFVDLAWQISTCSCYLS